MQGDEQRPVAAEGRRQVADHRRMLAASAAGVLGFLALLALVAVGGPLPRLDRAVRSAVDAHRDGTLTTVCRYTTDVLAPGVDAVVLGLGAVAVSMRARSLRPVLVAVAAGAAMGVVVIGVKHGLGRTGPQHHRPSPLSFPSGHTASALVCLGTLALLVGLVRPRWTRPLLATAAALTVAVAAALVYDDFHWLSDCVASALLGSAELALVHVWLRRSTASPSSAADIRPTGRTAHRR